MMNANLSAATSKSLSTAVYAKFGEASIAGFQAVPDLLLKHQQHLGLSSTDLNVLLNVLMYWWYPDQKPFPRSLTIAKRMGVSVRTVQRSLLHMESKNLLIREGAESGASYLNPMPLVARLGELARKDPDYMHRKALRDGREELGPHQQPPG